MIGGTANYMEFALQEKENECAKRIEELRRMHALQMESLANEFTKEMFSRLEQREGAVKQKVARFLRSIITRSETLLRELEGDIEDVSSSDSDRETSEEDEIDPRLSLQFLTDDT